MPPDDPQDAFVFDEEFIAGARFKEPTAKSRQGTRFTRWRAERRRRAMARKLGDARPRPSSRPKARALPKVGPRMLTAIILLALVGAAVVLNYLDPLGMHPKPAKPGIIQVTIAPTP